MMAIPPTWLPRIDSILDGARTGPVELDREQVMQLFGLTRREALRLMKRLSPVMERGRWLIERDQLVAWLERKQIDADQERRRRDRLTRGLLQADRLLPRPAGPFLSIAATEEMKQAARALPAGVTLVPGELRVEFTTMEELAQRILHTGVVLDRNFEHYNSTISHVDNSTNGQSEHDLELQDAEYFRNWQPGQP